MKKHIIAYKRSFLFCIAVTTMLFSSLMQSAPLAKTTNNKDVITIAVHEYYPYYINGEGLGTDIYREAFATQNIDIKIISYPIKRAIHKLVNLEVDALSPGTIFIVNPKILESVIYETSFFVTIGWLHKPENTPNKVSSLEGMLVASEATSLQYTNIYAGKGLKVINVENTERRLKMMLHDRVSYAAVTGIAGWSMLYKHNVKDFGNIEFTNVGVPFSCNLAFSKNNPRSEFLLSSFKKGMEIIRSNGTYLSLLENYWGKGNVPKDVLFESIKSFGVKKIDKQLLFNAIQKHNQNNLSSPSLRAMVNRNNGVTH